MPKPTPEAKTTRGLGSLRLSKVVLSGVASFPSTVCPISSTHRDSCLVMQNACVPFAQNTYDTICFTQFLVGTVQPDPWPRSGFKCPTVGQARPNREANRLGIVPGRIQNDWIYFEAISYRFGAVPVLLWSYFEVPARGRTFPTDRVFEGWRGLLRPRQETQPELLGGGRCRRLEVRSPQLH